MNEMPTVGVETQGERDAFDIFMAKVKELVAIFPEETRSGLLADAATYQKRMNEVMDPEEAARRLVMSRATESQITE